MKKTLTYTCAVLPSGTPLVSAVCYDAENRPFLTLETNIRGDIDGGYITVESSIPAYHYYSLDYQGNVRVVSQNSLNTGQVNSYYPFGALLDISTNGDVNAYKYNGKELDRALGLNLYDYHARQYDAALGRFTTMDPMAEKYYSISPYAYCANNPVNAVDPDGKSTRIFPYSQEELSMIKSTLSLEDREFVQLNEVGFIDNELLQSHESESLNYQKLQRLSKSELTYSVYLFDTYFYQDNFGYCYSGSLNYGGIEEDLKDTEFLYSSGNTTGERGTLGITLQPGISNSGINSRNDNDIEIFVTPKLSEIGRAETFSHEAYGHAYLYEITRDRVQSGHQKNVDGKDPNRRLANYIIQARKETVQNILKYGY